MSADAFGRGIAALADRSFFRAGVFLNQLGVVDFLKEGVEDLCGVRVEAVCRQLEGDFGALAQVLNVFLSRDGITLAHGKVDDEFGFGVNAKVGVLIPVSAVVLGVILLLAVNEGEQLVNLDKLKGHVADALVHHAGALLASYFKAG